ncbi:MAG TPA: serine/threonine-protein kinase, partial [Gemmatimonadales bacterium]|nr:serine/threonine-protein kinase [Gemmatimonadales bacterium]
MEIDHELGHGGMATVYLARDAKHDRLVALKVLRPELAAVLGTERFLREIQIAARLSHPHIVPLHDSGEAGGFLYYVMPFVEGESLRDRLRKGPLPVEAAVRLAGEVAGALAYAHAQGIVHRDIKPENILIQSGHAVVTDFGIARAVSVAGGPGLTGTGVTVGTPLYMSPEQIVGDPVDGRSDVYSLGCVLYEMMAGSPPFSGTTSLAVLAGHASDPIPSLRRRRADVPEALERTITKALAKQPGERYDSAAALVASLEGAAPRASRRATPRSGWALAAVTVVVLGVLGYVLANRHPTAVAKSIAVLPLITESGTQEDTIHADGMTEALIGALSQVPGLRVPGRMTSFVYHDSKLDPRTIGQQLKVATLLEGSFQRDGSMLQVSVRLLSADDGRVLWNGKFRRAQTDIFAFQDEISDSV